MVDISTKMEPNIHTQKIVIAHHVINRTHLVVVAKDRTQVVCKCIWVCLQ